MSVDENEDESPTEIGQILDELTDGFEDPTLLRLSTLSEEDVALDMDEVRISDCHGSAKPARSRVGSARVRVRVGYFRPAPYPDPHHGLGVTREKTRSTNTLNTI